MSEQEFDQEVNKIIANANLEPTLPLDPQGVVDRLRHRHQQLQTTAAALQGSLDSLRVSVKYLIFDLEATRRENASLKQQLAAARGDKDAFNDHDRPSQGD
jgi:hypothetical protein